MKRITLGLIGLLVSVLPLSAGDAGIKKTIAYVQKLQTDSGGFRIHDPKGDIEVLPTLRATSAAIRALKYFGGDLPKKDKCIKFVESCWDADAGAFADVPKGKAEVFTTAVGLMAVVELKMPTEKYLAPTLKYFRTNVKSFEEVRIAAAAFETTKQKAPKIDLWYKDMTAMRNGDDDTYGKGPGMARDTASVLVTRMRLGGPAGEIERNVKVLNDGQRQNGGWGKADNETASDLETTYRVMRCYHMLKAKPGNVEGVRSFVAKCRNSDGGYAVAPGQPSSVSGTYFAGIVLHWIRENPK